MQPIPLRSVLLGFFLVSSAQASVIFPFQQQHHHGNSNNRNRLKKDRLGIKNRSQNTLRHFQRVPSVELPNLVNSEYGMIKNFSSSMGQNGGLLCLGAAVIHVANKMRSESFKRAFFFWINAGPLVVHYKFTRWFLTKTKAPLASKFHK
jgi:hypothetical protein